MVTWYERHVVLNNSAIYERAYEHAVYLWCDYNVAKYLSYVYVANSVFIVHDASKCNYMWERKLPEAGFSVVGEASWWYSSMRVRKSIVWNIKLT